METEGLRWSLIIIGSLAIVGFAVHGIWISRKNNEKKTKTNKGSKDQEYQPSGWQPDPDSFIDVEKDLNEFSEEKLDDSNIKLDLEIDDEPLNLVEPVITNNDFDDFDDLGLGAVRVVSSEPKVEVQTDTATETESESETEKEKEKEKEKDPIPTQKIQSEPQTSSSKIYASVVTQPKPEYAAKHSSLVAETVAISKQERATATNSGGSAKVLTSQFTGTSNTSNNGPNSNDHYQAPEPPPFLLKKEVEESHGTSDKSVAVENQKDSHATEASEQQNLDDKPHTSLPHTSLAEKLSLSEQARNLIKRKRADTVRKRREPKIADDQMRIDFDDKPVAKPNETQQSQAVASEQPQEVLVLNVKSADDNPISGAALLPMLLTLGFKFGEQDIFHRHVNSNGKGPVLFSIANMFKPGNFDIDNLENFTTQGISLFMILPIEGEPHQVFNMMHNAARKIAEEFSAQIYDGKRTLLSKQSLQQYVEKIREFERQRLLKG